MRFISAYFGTSRLCMPDYLVFGDLITIVSKRRDYLYLKLPLYTIFVDMFLTVFKKYSYFLETSHSLCIYLSF